MILSKLQLNNFGKFKNSTFDFKPCTVFFGKNESGKTTIIDALFLLLLDKQTNSATVQLLQERYGTTYSARVEPDDSVKTLSLAELENFYLVRSSKLQVDFSGTASAGVIKSKLLETSLNLESLMAGIARDLGDRAKDSYGIKLKELYEKKKKLEELIAGKRKLMDSYTESAMRYKTVQLEINRAAALLGEIKNKKDKLTQNRDALKLQEQSLAYQLLEEKVAGWISRAEAYLEDKQRWERNYETLDPSKAEAVLAQEANLREQVQVMERETRNIKEKIQNLQTVSYRAKVLMPLFVIGILLITVGTGITGLGIVLKNIIPIILGFFGVVAGAAMLIIRYLRKNALIADAMHVLETAALPTLKAVQQYMQELEAKVSKNNFQDLQGAFLKAQNEKENLFRMYNVPHEQALRKLISEKDAAMSALKERFKSIIDTFPISDLRAAGVALNFDTNQLLNATDDMLKKLVAELKHRQRSTAETETVNEASQLPEIRRALYENEAKLKELDNEYRETELKKDNLLNRKSEIVKILAGFESHAAEYENAVKELETLNANIQKLELEKRGLTLVAQILKSIQQTMQKELNFIEKDIKTYFSSIVPAFDSIEVEDIAVEAIKLPDANNTARAVHHLSQGTQDLFYLGFRMLLGEYLWEEGVTAGAQKLAVAGQVQTDVRGKTKKRNKPGFFLWDEPFVSLDAERLVTAVSMLKVFQEKSGFQHVIFTKDPALVDAIKKTWPSDVLIIHNLSMQ